MWTVVKQALDRLVGEGILEAVNYADWASSIVLILKQMGILLELGWF